ncbi:MAG: sulfatase [Actinomycetota bacterium]|nr:sulfatase [Actinomycetota bacterium]
MAALLLAAAAATSRPPHAAGAKSKRPNILLVITDDQRSGLSVMPQTRRLLGRNGVTFADAYAPTPLCCPARASIFTGRYAHNHGVRKNAEFHFLNHDKTLQRYLDEAGYRTGIIGKFFSRWPLRKPPPHFDKYIIRKPTNDYFHSVFSRNGKRRIVNRYTTNFISDKAEDFLRGADKRSDSRPWLLTVTPQAPHTPFTPARKYETWEPPRWEGNPALEEDDKSDKPPYVQGAEAPPRRGHNIRRKQFRTLQSVDDMMGDLGSTLHKLDEMSNTLIIFVSDNGLMWAEHGLLKKGLPYQQSIGVPMLMRWDGHLKAGSVDKRLVSLVDLAPTILAAAGLEDRPAGRLDGRSLLNGKWERTRSLHEYWAPDGENRGDWAALHTKDYQYNEYYDQAGNVIFREYYDLNADPWELENLLGDLNPLNDPDVAALSEKLADDRSCRGPSCP